MSNIDDLSQTVVRIEGKLDLVNEKLDRLTETDKDHENRIRDIEKWKWRNGGIAAAVAAITTFVFGGNIPWS